MIMRVDELEVIYEVMKVGQQVLSPSRFIVQSHSDTKSD